MNKTRLCIHRLFLGCSSCRYFYVNEKKEFRCNHFDTVIEHPKVVPWWNKEEDIENEEKEVWIETGPNAVMLYHRVGSVAESYRDKLGIRMVRKEEAEKLGYSPCEECFGGD